MAISIRYSVRFSPCHIVNPSCEPRTGWRARHCDLKRVPEVSERYMAVRMYIRTLAYLVLRSVRVVNKLLGTRVLSVVMRNREILLCDDAVASAGFVLKALAVQKVDPPAH